MTTSAAVCGFGAIDSSWCGVERSVT